MGTLRHGTSKVASVGLPRFAVVDLETSGLSSRRNRILQVGMVTVEADGTVVDEWETLVKLHWPLARVGPTHVHGLRRKDLRGAPSINDVLDEFSQRLSDSIFTAHNSRFDGEFLEVALQRQAGRTVQSDVPALTQRLCTLRMSRRLDPDRELSHRLGDVSTRYGVTLDRPHDALADAAAAAAVLPHLLRAHNVRDVNDLQPFFDRPPKR